MGKLETARNQKMISAPSNILQRKCDGCKKKKEKAKGILQRAAVRDDPMWDVPSIVHEVLRTPGQPLDPKTQLAMEQSFSFDFSRVPANSVGLQASASGLRIGQRGDSYEQEAESTANRIMETRNKGEQRMPLSREKTDFSRVRVHTDPAAANSAKAVNALAYTNGQHIVFGSGQYSPRTEVGQKIIAHELVHVMQQNALGNFNMPGQILQRLEIQDCFDQRHEDLVREEHNLASYMLSWAFGMGYWTSDPRVQAAFSRHFNIVLGSPDFQDIYWQVLNVLYAILMASPGVVYECESNESWWSWWQGLCVPGVLATAQTNIHLCLPWWRRLNRSKELAAATLIHEWAHKWGPGVNRIFETYCHEPEYLNMSATERIKQPDAYANYAYELWTGKTDICPS